MRFPTLEEAIACNEAVRERGEVSPTADDDEPERVEQALRRAQEHGEPVEAAASLVYELTSAQGFYEGNKRTAVLLARWFIASNTTTDPDLLIRPVDEELGELLVATARGKGNFEAILDLFRGRLR